MLCLGTFVSVDTQERLQSTTCLLYPTFLASVGSLDQLSPSSCCLLNLLHVDVDLYLHTPFQGSEPAEAALQL